MKRYHYYVLVRTNKGVKLVTETNNQTRYARWEDTGIPAEFSRKIAEDIAFCLWINGFTAYTIKSINKIEKQF